MLPRSVGVWHGCCFTPGKPSLPVCSEGVMEKFDLRADCDPQTYGLGVKEVWEVPEDKHKPGFIQHTFGCAACTADVACIKLMQMPACSFGLFADGH